MKRIILTLAAGLIAVTGFSQFSVSVAGNYTSYLGDYIKKSGPGAQIRLGYSGMEQLNSDLTFTYVFPIKVESTVTITDNSGTTAIDVPSQITYKFKQIALLNSYVLIGDVESTVNFYGLGGFSMTFVNYDEKTTGSYNSSIYTNPVGLSKGKESSFGLNVGGGLLFKLGTPILFLEGGGTVTLKKAMNGYADNAIPTHITVNAGVRIPLGSYE